MGTTSPDRNDWPAVPAGRPELTAEERAQVDAFVSKIMGRLEQLPPTTRLRVIGFLRPLLAAIHDHARGSLDGADDGRALLLTLADFRE